MQKSTTAITFITSNHRENAKQRYEKMAESYYANIQEEIFEYNHEKKMHDRERQTLDEKFWIKWNKTHQPTTTTVITPSLNEPFIGPHNQTYIWEDADGYTVYSSLSKEALEMQRIQHLRELAKQKLAEKREQQRIQHLRELAKQKLAEKREQQERVIENNKVKISNISVKYQTVCDTKKTTRVQQLRNQAKDRLAEKQK